MGIRRAAAARTAAAGHMVAAVGRIQAGHKSKPRPVEEEKRTINARLNPVKLPEWLIEISLISYSVLDSRQTAVA